MHQRSPLKKFEEEKRDNTVKLGNIPEQLPRGLLLFVILLLCNGKQYPRLVGFRRIMLFSTD